MKPSLFVFLLVAMLFGCTEKIDDKPQPPVRGVKTLVIDAQQTNLVRSYPSVLQPAESSVLSFQVAGQVTELTLRVGQSVTAGQVIAQLDSEALKFSLQEAEAALDEATVSLENARKELARNIELKTRQLIGQAQLDNSETNVKTLESRVVQARNKYSVAKDKLSKAKLIAPFDGVINTVLVDSFDTVTAGTPIANIYNPNQFQARFSVSNLVASELTVGKPAIIKLADYPQAQLAGRVSELAESTDIVSSFPVVVSIDDVDPILKSGMAAEISMEFAVVEGDGYLIPLSAVLVDGVKLDTDKAKMNTNLSAQVFVFDDATNTVRLRDIKLAGVRANSIIVSAGLQSGERVVVAGVPFLREGQSVKLLESE